MDKKDFILYWKSTAKKDWTAVEHLFKSKDYIHALFFAHLVLEKLCKAHWVKDNKGNHPPRIHNLVRLVELSKLKIEPEDLDFFRQMNDFQIEGRYQDYKDNLYRIYKKAQTNKILLRVDKLRKCLLEQLP